MKRWFILFTNPSARAGYDTRSIFKRSLTGLNSEFSFSKTSCLTKAEEPSLSYYLPIAGGRIIGFIPFPRVLVLCERWFMHNPKSVRKNETHIIIWDFQIQTDHIISARRPDLVIINKKKITRKPAE